MASFRERLSDATRGLSEVQHCSCRSAKVLAIGFALGCVIAQALAQTNLAPPSAANAAERPWFIVTLNDSDPMLPAAAALDSARVEARAVSDEASSCTHGV